MDCPRVLRQHLALILQIGVDGPELRQELQPKSSVPGRFDPNAHPGAAAHHQTTKSLGAARVGQAVGSAPAAGQDRVLYKAIISMSARVDVKMLRGAVRSAQVWL